MQNHYPFPRTDEQDKQDGDKTVLALEELRSIYSVIGPEMDDLCFLPNPAIVLFYLTLPVLFI